MRSNSEPFLAVRSPHCHLIVQSFIVLCFVGIAVLDFRAAEMPFFVKRSNWPGYDRGSGLGLASAGNTLFVASDSAGLISYNISDPALFTRLAVYADGGSMQDVVVKESLAYVASANNGLEVFDISNPAKPALIGMANAKLQSLSVAENFVYGTDFNQGTTIFDTSNPAAPKTVSLYPGRPAAVAARDNLLFVADYNSGLEIVDITDRAHPARAGQLPGSLSSLTLYGNYIYAAARVTLRIVDISAPAAPREVGSYPYNGGPGRLAISGATGFLANWEAGLEVLDLSAPAQPKRLVTVPAGVRAYTPFLHGNTLFMGDRDGPLVSFDISDPQNPRKLASFEAGGVAQKVVIQGRYAYVREAFTGIQVLDISNANSPRLVGRYPMMNTGALLLDGNFAYAGEAGVGVHVLDISDPTRPVRIALFDGTLGGDSLARSGPHLLIANSSVGIFMVNVESPSSPVLVAMQPANGRINDLVVTPNYAYLAEASFLPGLGAIRVVDIRNPARPETVGTVQTDALLSLSPLGSRYLCAAHPNVGVLVIDLADPVQPKIVSQFQSSGLPIQVAVRGSVAYLVGRVSGLDLIDFSDPLKPAGIVQFALPPENVGIGVSDTRLCVAAGIHGVVTFEKGPLLDVSYHAGAPTFRFFAPAGLSFIAERTTRLSQPEWQAVSTGATAADGATFTDPLQQPRAFYRARISE